MEKRIKYSQFQQVKNAAKMIDLPKRKIELLKKKIEPLVLEMRAYQKQIELLEAGVVETFGFHVYDLVKKVIEPTGATNKDGKPVMVTKYLPTDLVSYDAAKKEYVVTIPSVEEGTNVLPPTTEGLHGSDYVADADHSQEIGGGVQSAEPENEQEDENALPWNN